MHSAPEQDYSDRERVARGLARRTGPGPSKSASWIIVARARPRSSALLSSTARMLEVPCHRDCGALEAVEPGDRRVSGAASRACEMNLEGRLRIEAIRAQGSETRKTSLGSHAGRDIEPAAQASLRWILELEIRRPPTAPDATSALRRSCGHALAALATSAQTASPLRCGEAPPPARRRGEAGHRHDQPEAEGSPASPHVEEQEQDHTDDSPPWDSSRAVASWHERHEPCGIPHQGG